MSTVEVKIKHTSGAYALAVCPYHTERGPSLMIDHDRFKCQACYAAGTAKVDGETATLEIDAPPIR